MNSIVLSSFRCLTLVSLSFIVLFSGTEVAQGQKLNRNLPSVYLTFKEFVPKTMGAYPSQGARLVLHNNTRWPIYYGEFAEESLPGDAPVIYEIELRDGRREERGHTDTVWTRKLMPGKTISFVVPKEDFPKRSEIYVEFSFSWELNQGRPVRYEATHRAYFLSNKLPVWP
jgi:hypothetical protein